MEPGISNLVFIFMITIFNFYPSKGFSCHLQIWKLPENTHTQTHTCTQSKKKWQVLRKILFIVWLVYCIALHYIRYFYFSGHIWTWIFHHAVLAAFELYVRFNGTVSKMSPLLVLVILWDLRDSFLPSGHAILNSRIANMNRWVIWQLM